MGGSTVFNIKRIFESHFYLGVGGGEYSQKTSVGVCGNFPNPSLYLWPKSAIFSTLFMTRPKIRYPIYDRYVWHSCPKYNFRRALVDVFLSIDNDDEVYSFKTRVEKP